ncbi:DNA-processing protein DprA [uncultured Vagococcus sp.]|uniref:DNA-processing protein DprA n=1 Tax=uncultured Vagococcus sp. TaxID=189676 RepID=UPI0028D71D67|nr:DNA-processing protein DprA [uncultured Vagococcus sp.]
MDELDFFIYRMKHVRGIGNKGLLKVVAFALEGDWQSITASEWLTIAQVKTNYRHEFLKSFDRSRSEISNLWQTYQRDGFLTILSENYPLYLKEIYNPPVGLFYRGNLDLLKKPALAMVGSRVATGYGKQIVSNLVPELVEKYVIVSGLAKGIDTSVHQQTIRHQGQTVGVVGTGLDVVYPQENFRLQQYLADRHLLLSEYPQGTAPLPYHFPARNRIIAGLAQGTIIIEAKQKSGSLITAQLALESGREVFAVPGSVIDGHSIGCLELIQQGAKCVIKGRDILEELSL